MIRLWCAWFRFWGWLPSERPAPERPAANADEVDQKVVDVDFVNKQRRKP
ncbi:hypothetical protein GCM10011348_46010 [Marinobacterium nitratireducens]|uniref:Uncharacterized protein n=1 Tax=Marinobacterium nitratireducens TaxID=518897 RepID=A0A917ZQL7_9GAMM|nr:hypothetical protein GCM10011348_46010 [Marinobacterium nitratireducens]